MLKTEPELLAELQAEELALVGRTKEYPETWQDGLLIPIYKKGEREKPQNYRPVCMLSSARKVLETPSEGTMAKKLTICGRQFGFQKGLSPKITLTDVDTVVRRGQDRIPTLDLTKAYDKVNSKTLMEGCETVLGRETTKMLTAFLQLLGV